MELLSARGSRLPIYLSVALVIVLAFASSRNSYASTARCDQREEGRRPKPSRQNVPSKPIQVATITGGQNAPKPISVSQALLGLATHDTPRITRGTLTYLNLVRATAQPEYLKLSRSEEPNNHLSPPL